MIKLAKITQEQEKELIQNIVNASKDDDYLPIQQQVGTNPDPFDYPHEKAIIRTLGFIMIAIWIPAFLRMFFSPHWFLAFLTLILYVTGGMMIFFPQAFKPRRNLIYVDDENKAYNREENYDEAFDDAKEFLEENRLSDEYGFFDRELLTLTTYGTLTFQYMYPDFSRTIEHSKLARTARKLDKDRYITDQDGYQKMLKELKNDLYSDLLWPCTFEIKRLEKDDPLKILPKDLKTIASAQSNNKESAK